jgi:hypothetical protein
MFLFLLQMIPQQKTPVPLPLHRFEEQALQLRLAL